jgi:hypothetical protein
LIDWAWGTFLTGSVAAIAALLLGGRI